MVGGYVQQSEGVREAGFNAEKGYQFTANITKDLDRGALKLYFRRTDDAGTWHLPVPLNVDGVDASYTQISSANRKTTVEGPFGGQLIADYGDGRGFDGVVAGGSLDYEFDGGWVVVDRFNYLEGSADTYGLVPQGGPRTIGDLGLASADTLISGRALGADSYVQHYGFWQVLKDIDSFSNDLSLTKQLGRGSATIGYFASRFGANDLWNLNNNARYLEIGGAREQVDIDCESLDPDLIPADCLGGYRVNARGDGQMDAFYLASDYEIFDNFRIDAGVRYVDHAIQYVAETGGDPVTGLTGTPDISTDYDESGVSWTIGANYAVTDEFGVFLRVNDGFRLPYFDDIREGQTQLAAGDDLFFDVQQYEAGLKYASNRLGLFLTAFKVDTQASRSITPEVGSAVSQFETSSWGLEFDGNLDLGGLSILANATYLDGEISADPDPELVGNQTPRQPRFQGRIAPAYTFALGNMEATLFGAYSYVGKRQSNVQNSQPLGAYHKLDLGAELQTPGGLIFGVFADNVTDEQGLTEGDPRSFDINANGRYILPRSLKFSVGYEF